MPDRSTAFIARARGQEDGRREIEQCSMHAALASECTCVRVVWGGGLTVGRAEGGARRRGQIDGARDVEPTAGYS